MIEHSNLFPYSLDKKYQKPTAYFSMEFAVDQSLKIYSGGLGFLAGSHLRSAYELKQNLVGIGILWKYGYYDQERNRDGSLKAGFTEKRYSFLTDTGIQFPIVIHSHNVQVKVWLLKPEIFNSAPLFLLSTDVPENDHLAQTICHRLYDPHESARIAQSILLGAGGARLLDELGRNTEVYHLNEGHALPLCFYLLNKFKSLEEVKKRVVFTTHTPEKAGNEEHKISTLEVMSFFQGADKEMIAKLAAPDKVNLNYTLTALRMSRRANGVSKLHGEVSQKMWDGFDAICPILSITNAQNRKFWMDKELERHFKKEDDKGIVSRKRAMKCELFKVVANQSGKLFDENALTIVWARRFAEYKRADLLFSDFARFFRMVSNKKFPVQFIWAGKPYPDDHKSVETFNTIFNKTLGLPNCTVLMGYEMELSALLKKGSDAWLNTPRMYREASGTSGMTAAMNGSLNVSMPDGWIPEFAKDKKNCFLVPFTKMEDIQEQDRLDRDALFNLMEQVVIPTYYNKPETWLKIVKQSMQDVVPAFDSDRMADAYYNLMYS